MSVSTFRPAIFSFSRRWFSAQAATQARQVEGDQQDVQITKLPSGMTVASLENNSPISRVSVIVKAGSRYEGRENLGVAHCLRTFGHLTTSGATTFSITRGLEDIGGSLETSTTRESITYTVQCLRDNLDTASFYLKNVSTGQEFRPWELNDNKGRLLFDLACYTDQPQLGVMEELHRAAYRETLGRSIYAPEFMVDSFSTSMLTNYVRSRYTANNMALVGMGVDHGDLKAFAETFQLQSADGTTEPAKFYGGEVRSPSTSPLAYAAVGVEGASMSSKDAVVMGVLQQMMGAAPYIKRGTNLATARAAQAAAQATSLPHAVNCFNLSYSDSGLFGVFAITQPNDMAPVLRAVVAQLASLTKGTANAKEVQRAKMQLKAGLLMQQENQEAVLDDLSSQVLHSGAYTGTAALLQAVDAVTPDDVSRVAKRIFNTKLCMASGGNLVNTPYLDQLMSA